ncbi:MAG: hypothetical protein AB9869_15900 [Verrucomicrobiia bacterium]
MFQPKRYGKHRWQRATGVGYSYWLQPGMNANPTGFSLQIALIELKTSRIGLKSLYSPPFEFIRGEWETLRAWSGFASVIQLIIKYGFTNLS